MRQVLGKSLLIGQEGEQKEGTFSTDRGLAKQERPSSNLVRVKLWWEEVGVKTFREDEH